MGGNCQVNDAVRKCEVTRSLPKNPILDLQMESGKNVFITINDHLNTRDIKTTPSSYMWHLKKIQDSNT